MKTSEKIKKGDLVVKAGYYGGLNSRKETNNPKCYVSLPVKVESWGKQRGTVSFTEGDDKSPLWWAENGAMSKCAVYNAKGRDDYFFTNELEAAEEYAREVTKREIIRHAEGTKRSNDSWIENYYNPSKHGTETLERMEKENVESQALVDSKAWETCPLVRVNLCRY